MKLTFINNACYCELECTEGRSTKDYRRHCSGKWEGLQYEGEWTTVKNKDRLEELEEAFLDVDLTEGAAKQNEITDIAFTDYHHPIWPHQVTELGITEDEFWALVMKWRLKQFMNGAELYAISPQFKGPDMYLTAAGFPLGTVYWADKLAHKTFHYTVCARKLSNFYKKALIFHVDRRQGVKGAELKKYMRTEDDSVLDAHTEIAKILEWCKEEGVGFS